MPLSRELVERRAIKAGVKASKKRHHLISESELLSLRVQTMSAWLRICLVLGGVLLIASSWFAWPTTSDAARVTEAIVGVLATLFGVIGIRRTLNQVVDAVGEIFSNLDF
jgi:peptidoglycan/LPS O-acetylase OafA/YrhL